MDYPKLNEHHLKIWNDQACGVCQRGPWTPYPPRGPAPNRLCPTWEEHRKISYSAQGWIQAARTLLDGNLEMEPEFVEYVYECSLCGSCSRLGHGHCFYFARRFVLGFERTGDKEL